MKKKENQRVTLTRRLLKESLLKLMAKKSVQQITVSELCQTAEINRSTFYNHYGCPADVLLDIEKGVVADLEFLWHRESETLNWLLNERVEAVCNYLLEHKDLAKLLLRNSDTSFGFASLIINSSQIRTFYEQVLSHANNQDSAELIITFLANGSYYMIRQWILEDIPKTPKEMGELVYRLATQGWEKTSDSTPVFKK